MVKVKLAMCGGPQKQGKHRLMPSGRMGKAICTRTENIGSAIEELWQQLAHTEPNADILYRDRKCCNPLADSSCWILQAKAFPREV